MTQQGITTGTTKLWDFDKGKDITPEGPVFDMTCVSCKSEDILIRPIGIPWKTQIDNSDLPPAWDRFYSNKPTLKQAILQAIHLQHGILIHCNKCNYNSKTDIHVDRAKLTRWLNKNKQ